MSNEEKFRRSAYLEEHRSDPVKWNIWGEEAFEISKKENKPLFITIGYSTCHWCHVMQNESFRNEKISKFLNENYIPIVVDREERPDVDSFYMEISQIMNGNGGWPLNVIALPDRRPFQVFTYMPPFGSQGNPGLSDLLNTISEIWKSERGRITDAADQISSIALAPDKPIPGEINIEETVETVQSLYDRTNGGFGTSPKFPNFPYLIFLMNYMRLKNNKSLSYIVQKTLKNIRNGGIYDQVGHGLHRYSTDSEWKIPHFEKMLYDQAMAIFAFTQFFRLIGEEDFLDVSKEIIEFVDRDMKTEDGFYAAGLDADFNGMEGEYYTWSDEEIKNNLQASDGRVLEQNYYLERDLENRKVLRRRETVNASRERAELLKDTNKKLLELRSAKGNLKKDDKAILSWNSMLLSSMLQFSKSSSGEFSEEVIKIGNEIMISFSTDGKVYRTIRNGIKGVDGMLEDYAYYSNLMVDLYEFTFDERYLREAIKILGMIREKFFDTERGGFYSVENIKDKPVRRGKERLDIIYPSGESVLYVVLEKMYLLTSSDAYREMSDSILHSRLNDIVRNPLSSIFLLSFIMFRGKMKKIEIPANLRSAALKALGDKDYPEVVLSKGKNSIEVCDDKACQFHGKAIEEMIEYLNGNI